MAATLDEEIYYPVRTALVNSFMKVPNCTLKFRKEFQDFTANPLPVHTLREIYLDRITEAIHQIESSGASISPKSLNYLERVISTVEILPDDASQEELENLISIR